MSNQEDGDLRTIASCTRDLQESNSRASRVVLWVLCTSHNSARPPSVKIFGDRLMVGHGPLKPSILVRIQVPEPRSYSLDFSSYLCYDLDNPQKRYQKKGVDMTILRSAICVGIGFFAGSFILQLVTDQDWGLAVERGLIGCMALVTLVLTHKVFANGDTGSSGGRMIWTRKVPPHLSNS